jgi:hypothetical protein
MEHLVGELPGGENEHEVHTTVVVTLDLHISLLQRHDALKEDTHLPDDTYGRVPSMKATRALVSAPSAASMAGVRGITRSSKRW